MDLTAILVTHLHTTTDKFHSPTPERKEIPSAIMVLRVLWAMAAHIIDKVAEAEAAPLDIKVQQI